MSEELEAKLAEALEKIEALERSNAGLKADLTKAKVKAKGAEIDPEVHAALEAKVEELTQANSKLQKESTKTIEQLTGQLKEKDGSLTSYLIESQLTDTLAKSGVLPEFMDATKALLKGQATIKAEGGEYKAMIGDKPLVDAVKEWASGETGKHFIKADVNNGGGSGGGQGGGGTQKEMTREAFQRLPQEKKVELSKSGVKIID